jgi:hypothetical protein
MPTPGCLQSQTILVYRLKFWAGRLVFSRPAGLAQRMTLRIADWFWPNSVTCVLSTELHPSFAPLRWLMAKTRLPAPESGWEDLPPKSVASTALDTTQSSYRMVLNKLRES